MSGPNRSIAFFDSQFLRQVRDREFGLNPFEQRVLPHLAGRVLDFGCGMGNLALAAASRGCIVQALDASATAVAHIGQRAADERLPVSAIRADLRDYDIVGQFDAVVSIGLLMFFDGDTARRRLVDLQRCAVPGGIVAINVLVQGTTYLDMFDPAAYCLFERGELARRFEGWAIRYAGADDFAAPGNTNKSFETLVACKPGG